MWMKCLEKSVVSPEDPVMIKHLKDNYFILFIL